MKKLLIILPFLILFLPMWQSCERKIAAEATEEKHQETQILRKFLSVFDKENSISGYELIWISIESPINLTKMLMNNEFDEENFTDISFTLALFSFFLYAIISIVLIILTVIKKKERLLFWLSTINLCFIFVSYFMFLYNSSNMLKIKYGFYLLIINSLLIFLCSISKKVKL